MFGSYDPLGIFQQKCPQEGTFDKNVVRILYILFRVSRFFFFQKMNLRLSLKFLEKKIKKIAKNIST